MEIMIFITRMALYVPVFYVHLQSKDKDVCRLAPQSCISAAKWSFLIKPITCDFKKGLINAMKGNFDESVFVGCFFHWKQEIRKNLIKQFYIPLDLVSELMDGNGLINQLNVISVVETIVGYSLYTCKF